MALYFFILLFSINFADCWGMKEGIDSINISGQKLTSEGLREKIKNIKNKDRITSLSLRNNHISDLSSLKMLPNLEELDLSFNNIVSVDGLQDLKNLKKLYLDSNKIKDASLLAPLKIVTLSLSNNNIKNLDSFRKFKKLKELVITCNPIKAKNKKNQSAFVGLKRSIERFDYSPVVEDRINESADNSFSKEKQLPKLTKHEKEIGRVGQSINLKELYEARERRLKENNSNKLNIKSDEQVPQGHELEPIVNDHFKHWQRILNEKAKHKPEKHSYFHFTPLKFRQSKEDFFSHFNYPTALKKFEAKKIDTTLYQWWQSKPLLIPLSVFNFNEDYNAQAFKELFIKNKIITGVSMFSDDAITPWTEKEEEEAYQIFKRRANGDQDAHNSYRKLIYINELTPLLKYAKKILTLFLPLQYTKIDIKNFIKKGNPLGRIFTCYKIKRVIKERGLSSVRVPQKFLIVYDKRNQQVINDKKSASEIIERNLKFSLISDQEVRLSENLGDYGLYVLAKKEVDHRKMVSFNENAKNELKILVREVPFDIGYDNIFTDNKGNAIIIDTEFKGEDEKSSLSKLNRYF